MTKFAVRYLKNMYYPLDIPTDVEINDGDMVLVRTEKGEEALKAFLVNKEIAKIWDKSKQKPDAFPLIRVLGERDKQILEDIKKEEIEAFFKCKALVEKHKLVMNLVQSRFTFDKKKITFYYTAPERVDFRELLKDLTQTFKRVRIDLRHIGVRDETSIMEGCGICGKEFCCCTFLKKFGSINVKLAKDQGMPITPGKISGTCGRLLCCLNYEYSNYIEAAKGMPPVGSSVMTPDGLGKVCALHFLNNSIQVKLEDSKIKDYQKADIEVVDADVNVDINTVNTAQQNLSYSDDAKDIDLKSLEDDKNSSTGNI
jgi:cell fate regulator YaaT (PSP1 superfamily)